MANKSGLLLFQGKKKKTQKEKDADVVDNFFDWTEKQDTKTMRVKINPSKEGELSTYGKEHVTKTTKKGKVVIKVSKADMWSDKSKLFDKDYESFKGEDIGKKTGKTYYKTTDPAAQSSAKGFKKARTRERVAKAGAWIIGTAISPAGGVIKDLFGRK